MHEDTVVSFSHPDRISIQEPLTEVLRRVRETVLPAMAARGAVEAWIVDDAENRGRPHHHPVLEPLVSGLKPRQGP